MKHHGLYPLLAVLLIMTIPGCEWGGGGGGVTPEETQAQRLQIAKDAGSAAALVYLVVDKPENEKAAKIQTIIDKVREGLTEWKEGGFATSLPELEALIDKTFQGEENKAYRLAARNLARTLVTELDNLFDKHPEWKDKGAEVAALVASFTEGASKAFEDYIAA